MEINVTSKDLPTGKTFATMTASDFKSLGKAQLAEMVKVA